MDAKDVILVVTGSRGSGEEATRSWSIDREDVVPIPVAKLSEQMNHFLDAMSIVFRNANEEAKEVSGLILSEVNVSVEITGEGEIRLLGTGGKVAANGRISLSFKST